MKKERMFVFGVTVLALMVVCSAGVQAWEMNPVDVTGTWDLDLKEYVIDVATMEATYEEFSLVMVVEEQTGSVFTGYAYSPYDPDAILGLNGAIHGRNIRLGTLAHVMTAKINFRNELNGTVQSLLIDPFTDFGTGTITGRKRAE